MTYKEGWHWKTRINGLIGSGARERNKQHQEQSASVKIENKTIEWKIQKIKWKTSRIGVRENKDGGGMGER